MFVDPREPDPVNIAEILKRSKSACKTYTVILFSGIRHIQRAVQAVSHESVLSALLLAWQHTKYSRAIILNDANEILHDITPPVMIQSIWIGMKDFNQADAALHIAKLPRR